MTVFSQIKQNNWPSSQNQFDDYLVRNCAFTQDQQFASKDSLIGSNRVRPLAAFVSDGASISTAQSKYYGSSLFVNGGARLRIDSPPQSMINWTIASSAFTIEYWVRSGSFASTTNTGSVVLGSAATGSTGEYWSFGPRASGNVVFYYYNGSPQSLVTSGALSLNTWHHIAFTRSGTSMKIYIDGVESASGSIAGTPQYGTDLPFLIGNVAGSTSSNFYIQDLRIYQGLLRYTGSFTPPGPILL